MKPNEPAKVKGIRLGNFLQIRDIIDEEFQALLAGDKDAQGALDAVVERGNALLREFETTSAQ